MDDQTDAMSKVFCIIKSLIALSSLTSYTLLPIKTCSETESISFQSSHCIRLIVISIEGKL